MDEKNKTSFIDGYLVKIWTTKTGKRYAKIWNADKHEEILVRVSKSAKL